MTNLKTKGSMEKLLVNQGDIAKHFKLTPPRVHQLLDSLGVKPLVPGKNKLWRWSDIIKALGGDETAPVAQAKLVKAVKPSKVSVGGIWLDKPDSDRLDAIAGTLGVKRSDIVKSALFDYMDRLDPRSTNGVGAHA